VTVKRRQKESENKPRSLRGGGKQIEAVKTTFENERKTQTKTSLREGDALFVVRGAGCSCTHSRLFVLLVLVSPVLSLFFSLISAQNYAAGNSWKRGDLLLSSAKGRRECAIERCERRTSFCPPLSKEEAREREEANGQMGQKVSDFVKETKKH